MLIFLSQPPSPPQAINKSDLILGLKELATAFEFLALVVLTKAQIQVEEMRDRK